MSENFLEKISKKKLKRRSFLKWSGAATVPAILGGAGVTRNLIPDASAAEKAGQPIKEEIIPTASVFDCGGKCIVKAHVKDGVITRITTRSDEELDPKNPIMKACVKGRGYRMYQYHPDRLKYPMKRVGKRGEGKFERITWDEAIDTIVSEIKRITEKYGPLSRYVHFGSAGTGGNFPGWTLAQRLFVLTGGYLNAYHSYSLGNTLAATPYTYGEANTGSSLDSLENTKLVILWGHNPVETMFGNSNHYYQKMKQNGTKFIVVDPRYSDTAVAYADEWIPILPTTDNALMDAMAYVIITENLHDQEFLNKYCVGFDDDHMPEGVPGEESLKSYLLGKKDGIPKTPEWAEKICKVPANKIRQLAIEYATTKPAALIQGWGPQRHACGERTARGATVLATITGNVGRLGAWASGYGGIARRGIGGIPVPENPAKAEISIMSWIDAVEDASKITPEDGLRGVDKLDQNIKLIFNMGGNALVGMHPNINRCIKALEDESKVEFIVATEHVMTSSARYADILLPDTTFFEEWAVSGSWGSGDLSVLSRKIVDNFYEARSEYDWLSEVAERLGVGEEFTEGRTQLEWNKYLLAEAKKADPDAPTFEELEKVIAHRWNYDGPRVPFKEQIENPEENKFNTPSGKIEIFSKQLYDMKHEEIPAIPRYIPSWEGPEDEITEKYPLQLIGWKQKNRANSVHYDHPWLEKIAHQQMWMNPIDAEKRGIKQGDRVKVYNDRGATMIEVKVTSRIMPGVVAIPTGAYYQPDENGVDQNGCSNVLTTDRMTPLAHGNAHHTCLVEVEKA